MKLILRSTNANRGLLNNDGKFLPGGRLVCAQINGLIEQRIAKGDFKLVVGNLDDEATDEEFVKFLTDSGDEQLALDSFESKYSLEPNRRRVEETADEKAKREKAEQDQIDADKLKADADKAKAEQDQAAIEKPKADAEKADAAKNVATAVAATGEKKA